MTTEKLSERLTKRLTQHRELERDVWESYIEDSDKQLITDGVALESRLTEAKPVIVALLEAKLDYDATVKLDSIDVNRELIIFAKRILPILESDALEVAFGGSALGGIEDKYDSIPVNDSMEDKETLRGVGGDEKN